MNRVIHKNKPNSDKENLPFQIMALEIISELLLSSDLSTLAQKLTEQLRELTGSNAIFLLGHTQGNGDDTVLNICPARKGNLFSQREFALFCPGRTPGALPLFVEDFPPDHPLCLPLRREGIVSILRFPLNAGGELIGSLVFLNLTDTKRVGETIEIINLFSNVITLALKNAMSHELIKLQASELAGWAAGLEQKVEERTAELRAEIAERLRAEEKIKNLLAEKDTLLREVYHRIKNNMNTIKGLLSLQIASEKNPSAAASLKDAEDRVQSMIVLYDRLNCTDNYRELSVKDYLEPLTQEIVHGFPSREKVTVETDIEDFILSLQQLTPLGIIVNELITNMMKHAFAGRERGVIRVSAAKKDNRIVCVIRDDGIGLPESVSFENSTGFGMRLVHLLVEQLGGTIRIERVGGTSFIIEM